MQRLFDEQEVHGLEDSPRKKAMIDQICQAHGSMDGLLFDALADCGGSYYLLEPGDDPTAIPLHDDDMTIDLTAHSAEVGHLIRRKSAGCSD